MNAIERSSDRGLNGMIGFMVAAALSGAVCWLTGHTVLSADLGVVLMNMTVLPLGVLGGFMMSNKAPARPVFSALYFVAASLIAFIGVKGLLGGSGAMIGFQFLAAAASGALAYSRTLGTEDELELKRKVVAKAIDWNHRYAVAAQSLAATSMNIEAERQSEYAVMADFERRLRQPADEDASVVFSFCESSERVAA